MRILNNGEIEQAHVLNGNEENRIRNRADVKTDGLTQFNCDKRIVCLTIITICCVLFV